jgi:Zn-dependent protease
MDLSHIDIISVVFQLIAFLFAISVHESAHAWMANRCGDPTARMLGRITLNPAKHIDPIGTLLLPALAAYYNVPMLGWAKPTPVDPRNFKNPVLDDVLTSVVGPVSNFLIAVGALILLAAISVTSTVGHELVHNALYSSGMPTHPDSALAPFVLLLYEMMGINIVLGVFNLIPVPPLDGSHVLRHFLSDSARRVYDSIGVFGLVALVFLGRGLLYSLISPPIKFFNSILARI